jgi:hypothetical protein
MARGDKVLITIRIYAGDRERLQRFFPSIDYNRAIREIVHQQLNVLEEALNKKGKVSVPVPDIALLEQDNGENLSDGT